MLHSKDENFPNLQTKYNPSYFSTRQLIVFTHKKVLTYKRAFIDYNTAQFHSMKRDRSILKTKGLQGTYRLFTALNRYTSLGFHGGDDNGSSSLWIPWTGSNQRTWQYCLGIPTFISGHIRARTETPLMLSPALSLLSLSPCSFPLHVSPPPRPDWWGRPKPWADVYLKVWRAWNFYFCPVYIVFNIRLDCFNPGTQLNTASKSGTTNFFNTSKKVFGS